MFHFEARFEKIEGAKNSAQPPSTLRHSGSKGPQPRPAHPQAAAPLDAIPSKFFYADDYASLPQVIDAEKENKLSDTNCVADFYRGIIEGNPKRRENSIERP
jgi:hypothetical protein